MLVDKNNFSEVVEKLRCPGLYGLDTETTGLSRADRLFSIILADEKDAYYFNFNSGPDHLGQFVPPQYVLTADHLRQLDGILAQEASVFFLHNAKFDLHMLAREDLFVAGTVHCTLATERVLRNNYLGHRPYSLDSCAKRRGLEKDDSVDKYVKEHKLSTRTDGKERKHYDRVPFELISAYGQTDARITRQIALAQLQELKKLDDTAPEQAPKMWGLVGNEARLTKVCFRMEDAGIQINRDYTQGALKHYEEAAKKAAQEFKEISGLEFGNSPTILKSAFAAAGVELPRTPTGKPCTNKKALEEIDHPLGAKIREIRGYEKLCSTYFSSFLHFADDKDVVHPDMRQGGTETGRFSYANPNLQNVPKEDDPSDLTKPYIVRKCFVPRPGFCFVAIDYQQQEYRMLLDYAGEHAMIDAVNGGLDVHEATAQMVGVTRKQAKTLNFGLLYGMGPQKLAVALNIPYADACTMRAQYFAKLPRVSNLIKGVMRTGEARGYIWNWFGFRNHITSSDFAYVLPNHLIQGGCAQVVRVAMVKLDEMIRSRRLRSQPLLQIHDEILFEIHMSELDQVSQFESIMSTVYKPKNGLHLTCSIESSLLSWGKVDMKKGLPNA